MSQVAFIENAYSELNHGDAPQWLSELRDLGMQKLRESGLPTTKDEEWKYTPVGVLNQSTFSLANEVAVDAALVNKVALPGSIRLVFVDGLFVAEASDLSAAPAGVVLQPLSQASHGPEAQAGLGTAQFKSADAFTHMNQAFTRDGAWLNVPKNTQVEPVIQLIHVASATDLRASFGRHIINVETGAQAHVVETYVGQDGHVTFRNSLTEVRMAPNSHATHVKINLEGDSATHVGMTRAFLERDAQLASFVLTLGGRLVRNNVEIEIADGGAHAFLDGLYLLDGNQLADNHTTVFHKAENATSSQLYKGLLKGRSNGIFSGKIVVDSIAQQTNAYQMNQNLLLDDTAQINTKPMLEIFADDVKCSHGATVGQMEAEEVFYLQSRGIEKSVAEKMLARGFADDAFQNIPNEAIVSHLGELINGFFD